MNNQSTQPVASIIAYADLEHRESVIQLWRATLNYIDGHNEAALVIDKKLAVGDGLLFVAVTDTKVIGTAMAGYDGHRGWLYSVCVDQHLRGLGIGADLVRHAEAALMALGCVKINLQIADGNDAVTGFYERMGFVLERRISMGKVI